MEETPRSTLCGSVMFRQRSQLAVDNERMELLRVLSKYWPISDSDREGLTPKQKWAIWDEITEQFNALPAVTAIRTPLQVKTLFKNMKTKARRYQIRLQESHLLGKVVEADPVSNMVLEMLDGHLNWDSYGPGGSYSPHTVHQDIANVSPKQEFSENSLSNEQEGYGTDDDIKDETLELLDSPCVLEERSPVCNGKLSSCDPVTSSSTACILLLPETSTVLPQNSSQPFEDMNVTTITKDTPAAQCDLNNSDSDSSHNISQAVTVDKKDLVQGDQFVSKISTDLNRSGSPSPKIPKLPDFWNKSRRYMSHPSSNNTGNFGVRNCCCPEYHKEMLDMSRREHEVKLRLLEHELLLKKEEMKLKEAERQLKEEELKRIEEDQRVKMEEREARLAEHKVKLKLLELELRLMQQKSQTSVPKPWAECNGSENV